MKIGRAPYVGSVVLDAKFLNVVEGRRRLRLKNPFSIVSVP